MPVSTRVLIACSCAIASLAFVTPASTEPRLETLQRGLVAVRTAESDVYLSWRLLGHEPDSIAFDVYRRSGDQEPTRLSAEPITDSTNFVDHEADQTMDHRYLVRPILGGQEGTPSTEFAVTAGSPAKPYFEVPLQTPEGYTPGDIAPGDLDGDGEYELVVHMAGRSKDNSQAGPTDPPILQAYKTTGEHLWSIHLGRNIREGAHYTQFLVYDLDGDGVAEIVCKTADGTVDGLGKVIGDANANWVGSDGRILRGPEYLTVFDGRKGAAIDTVDYIPPRGDIGGWGGVGGNGGSDRSGNRVDRFLACVAYLDGERASVVTCRGYYGRSVLAAWDLHDRKLKSRWVFDTHAGGTGKDGRPLTDYAGMGGHSVSVADVDDDGRDEVVYHSMVVDDDGQGLFTTGLRDGDALHVSRFDPKHPNPIVFGVHENEGGRLSATTPAAAAYDAKTGRIVWRNGDGEDAPRGLAADIDPRYEGAEMWGGPGGLRTVRGESIGRPPRPCSFAIWWDGDLLRELVDGASIVKWDWEHSRTSRILTADGCAANNGSKATPALTADLFGDWREEIVWRTADNRALRIFTTTVPAKRRLPTLMHDRQYRLSVAWQNVGYNQPPHTSYFLGEGMVLPIDHK